MGIWEKVENGEIAEQCVRSGRDINNANEYSPSQPWKGEKVVPGGAAMAQKAKRARGIMATGRRLLLGNARGPVLACIVLVVVCGGVGHVLHNPPGAVTVERGDYAGEASGDLRPNQGNEGEDPTENSLDHNASSQTTSGPETVQSVYVHVDGAVVNPGMYCVEGIVPRVNDAVEMAGGLTAEANTSLINLASPLVDGQKVHVPAMGEDVAASVGAQSGQTSAGWDAGTDNGSFLININEATEEELRQLPGVGEAIAAAIVKDREQNGRFGTKEDIMRVSGIGEKKYQKLEELICV